MFLLVTKMYQAESINKLDAPKRELIERCCKHQLPMVASGDDFEETVQRLCDTIAKDQIPAAIAFSKLEEFEFPDDCCIIDVARINEHAHCAGIFPDDWEEAQFNVGSFYINGKKV